MQPKTKRILWIGVPVLVIIIAAAATYKMWWYKLNKREAVTNTVFDSKPVPTEQHGIFIPKTSDAFVAEINSQTKQVIMASSGAVYVADGGSGSVRQTFTAEHYPDALLNTTAIVDSDYFVVAGQSIERFDHNGKFIRAYTTKDGLANGYNLQLRADPFASHTLWIETFDGLSRLDTAADKIRNFDQDLGTGGHEYNSINGINLTGKAVWVRVLASSASKGSLNRMDRATGQWQHWGPESFGQTDRVDFNAVAANSNHAIAQIGTTLYEFQGVQKNTWEKMPSLEFSSDGTGVPYQSLYIEGDYLYAALNDGSLQAALLTDSEPSWQNIIQGSGNFNERSYQEPIKLIPDTAEGLWMATDANRLTHLVSGATGESLQLPTIESAGDFFGATGSGVYYGTPHGFGRYDITTGKSISWLTDPKSTDYSDLRIVKESGGYAYIAEGSAPGYGGGGLSRFVRLSLSDSNAIDQYKAPQSLLDAYEFIHMADDGRIFMIDTSKKKPVVTVFDWDKHAFVPGTAPENLEALADSTIYPYPNFPIKHGDISITEATPDSPTTLRVAIRRGSALALAVTLNFSKVPADAFGNPQNVMLNNVAFDNTDATIAWLATNRGLVRLNLGDRTYKIINEIDGSTFTAVPRVSALGDFIILSNEAGTYIYPKSKFN